MSGSRTPTVEELEKELELARQLLAEMMGCASICPFHCDAHRRAQAYLFGDKKLPPKATERPHG